MNAVTDNKDYVIADLGLADPGTQVVSYEIDACLAHGSAVGCGADTKSSRGQ